MQHQSITPKPAPGLPARTAIRHLLASPVAAVLLFSLALLALNPVGYKGGGADEWHYVQAARCAAEQGFCLPEDHWWRRFALVIPAGLAIRLFGLSQFSVSLFPLLCGIGAIGLFVGLVQRQFGRREALIGGLAFAATPVVGERLLEMNVDMTELMFLLGAISCLEAAHRGGRRWLFPAAGALLGLAILCRPTQLALVPIFGAAFWLVRDWRGRAPAFAAGLLAPLLAEAAVYAVWAGDALFSWKLSLEHTQIPSSELESGVDLTQSPLFNIAYIDGWKPSMGLSAHWTVEGLLNLLIHPRIGVSLVAALMLIGLDARRFRSGDPRAKVLLFLIGAAMAFFGALVYAFAIDPKPRMFLPVLAVACAAFSYFGAERIRTGQHLMVIVFLALLGSLGLASTLDRIRMSPVAATAAEWIRSDPNRIAVSALAESLLVLTPEGRQAPVGWNARSKVLAIQLVTCRDGDSPEPGWRLIREQSHSQEHLRPFPQKGLLQSGPDIAVCLYERSEVSGAVERP